MVHRGFTLIELMIVIAIVGILSLFALPMYQDYVKRTYISEGMGLVTSAKTAVTEFYSSKGTWPATNSEAGLETAQNLSGQSVLGVGIEIDTNKPSDTGSPTTNIIVLYNKKVTGRNGFASYRSGAINGTITISPSEFTETGSVVWQCTALNGNQNTQTTANGAILGKWLPANCRNEIN